MGKSVFLEAETFDSVGGWTVDTQCLEALGAFFLLAHGVGRPVSDATTRFVTDIPARWHVHARTRDWTAEWGRGTPAGRFILLVDGAPLPQELGTNGTAWGWQKAGEVDLEAGTHTLALHDLTGFDGRCDAVYLTTAADDVPPAGGEALAAFRRNACATTVADDPAEYDLIVCGGGFAGVCTALAANRKGLRALLVQDRPVLGGCGSSEVRVWIGGKVNLPPYPALGNLAAAISPIRGRPGDKKEPAYFEDDRKAVLFNPGQLLLGEAVVAVEADPANPHRIAAVVTRCVRTGRETRRRAKLFADCTGDAFLSRRMGCETMYGTEGHARFGESLAPAEPRREVMGHSTLWETDRRDRPVDFPDVDWGYAFTDETALARFDCCWDWETGQYRDQVLEIERIRDYGLMTCFANWSFMKNHSRRKDEWRDMDLAWISPIGGKRESYRVIGDYILTQNEIEAHTPLDDLTGPVAWSIDLHYPDPENRALFGEAFQSCAYHRGYNEPYAVPYRCLYARDVDNLFLGGRCISLSHVAFSCVRVMRTLGALGEVAGIAAEICVRHACTPRAVYREHLAELREQLAVGIAVDPPCGYMPGGEEAYHFMRPAGMYGNSSENCWFRFGTDGNPRQDEPPRIAAAIRELGVEHRNGKVGGR